MIILESKLVDNIYVDGYYLTLNDLKQLMRDFQVDCYDGFVSNDGAYIENWLKNHERIVKKD
jgi:hypothetical protein